MISRSSSVLVVVGQANVVEQLHHEDSCDVEGVFSRQQFIGEDAKCPDVNCFIVLFVSHKFGSEIEWCPALGIPHGLISEVD